MGFFNDALRAATSAPERHRYATKIGEQEVEFFAPPLTGTDLDRLMLRHKNFATAPTIAATVDLIIAKVENEDGTKAFDIADKPFLMKMSLDWINALRSALFPNQDTDLSDEAIEKELGN